MLSTRELCCVITGRSSLSNPKSIQQELERFNEHLQNGVDFYKKPNSISQNKVKSTDSVKRKDFILKLSELLDLDEWQTHELFQNYLRMEFRGSGPQLQTILKHDVQLEGFLLKVLEFYLKERCYLLKCIKYLVSYWQDETCLFRDTFSTVVDNFANENTISKIVKQLKNLSKQPAVHPGIKGNSLAQAEFALQYLKEQCDLAEIIFLYYKDFEMPVDVFLDLATFFRRQHFGVSQINRRYFTPEAHHLIERFGYISSLILLEALDLDFLRKSMDDNNSPDDFEHPFVTNRMWKKIDELLYTWDDVVQQGPVLMAWTVFRHVCLPQEQQQLTKLFGDAAMRCNLISYLDTMLSYPLFERLNDPLAGLIKTFVYILLGLMLHIFHEDTLGDYQEVLSIACKVLAEPTLSAVFFTQDKNCGISMLINSARRRFPFAVCPYLNILKSLSTSYETSDFVFDLCEKQDTFTELFGKNSVSEIEACELENVWRRTVDRVVLNYRDDSVVLSTGVCGKILSYKQETRLIRWTTDYSGWLYLMLQLNVIADNPMTYTSDSGEDAISIAVTTIDLVSVLIEHDPRKVEVLEPIISTVFNILRRVSQLSSPPLVLTSSCLRCFRHIVVELPLQTWSQLSVTKFLPFQKQLCKSGSARPLQLDAGLYGTILNQFEIPSNTYVVTKEYLNFLLMFSTGLVSMEGDNEEKKILLKNSIEDIAVNVVFVLKEILSNFARWRYRDTESKEKIGLRCLEICHLILSPTFLESNSPAIGDKKLSLKTLVKEGLLYHGGGEALLNIISIGVDNVETLTNDDKSIGIRDYYFYLYQLIPIFNCLESNPAKMFPCAVNRSFLDYDYDCQRQSAGVIQLVKLSFAVLNLLLQSKDESSEIAPLEASLQQQYVTQLSELDFIQPTSKVTLLSVIARYIYHKQDPKLPILATIVLRSLALKFPLVLTSSFGGALVGLRNAFVNRLNGRVEALRLKVSIIEFLTACVETQPGIIESFCHITSVGKENAVVFGKFSCVTPIIENIESQQYFDILSAVSLEFISALWINRYDVAMSLIKKSKSFWKIVTGPLLELQDMEIMKSVLEVTTHVLNLVTYESFCVKSDLFDEELSKNLQHLTDGKTYCAIGKFLICINDDEKVTTKEQFELLKAWKRYLTVMTKLQPCSCGLESKTNINRILNDVIVSMKSWLVVTDKVLTKNMLSELADLCWILTNKWIRSLNEPFVVLQSINFILNELLTSNEDIFKEVQESLYATVLVILQEETDDMYVKGVAERMKLTVLVCKWLQFRALHTDNQAENQNQSFQLSISLLNQIQHGLSRTQMEELVYIYKEYGIIHNSLDAVGILLKEKTNLGYAELILNFLTTCSQKLIIAEHLYNNGIGKFLCLSVQNIHAESTPTNETERFQMLKIWSLVVGIAARLLKMLKHVFLESILDFVGTHIETILQSMNIVEQVVSGDNLYAAEQVSILCYELSQYATDVAFALPTVLTNVKVGVAQMLRLSIALVGRQRLLGHLVECKTEDNIERLLIRVKTPSPTSLRGEGQKSLSSMDILEQLSPNAEVALNRLINILSNSIGALRRWTPNVIECILDEGMDIDMFVPLVDLSFNSPSLESNSQPSFGTLISCLITSLKMIQKMSESDSDRTTPDKDFASTSTANADKQRSALWFIIDNALIVLISQASCYLRHPNVDERGKQFLKRELNSELSNFIHAVHRFRTRRGVPPSPISLDKFTSTNGLSTSIRRSPSKLSTSFLEEEENSLFKLVDVYAKSLR